MSQKAKILEALKRGEAMTPLKALTRFGCLSLSQRCGELVRDGHPIIRTQVKTKSGKRVGYYMWGG
jgi:hypothetical protein